MRTINIFIIEDDELTSKLLKLEVENQFNNDHNLRISIFKTGEQCHLTDHKPHIAIVDYHLNSHYKNAMDGIEVLERFKTESPDTTLILLTGEDNASVIKRAISLGISDHIMKDGLVFLKLKSALLHQLQLLELRFKLKRQKAMALYGGAFLLAFGSVVGLSYFFSH